MGIEIAPLNGSTDHSHECRQQKSKCHLRQGRAFAYYNVELSDYHVESGEFEILVGRSSEDIVLSDTIHVESTVAIKTIIDSNTMLGDILSDPQKAPLVQELLQKMQEGLGGLGAAEILGEGAGKMFAEMMKYIPYICRSCT
ncbi:hypothetical protein GCM10008933_32800 [Paenibacillus motobuensis]|uniref:Uncharacterized protein n=1 Tax=Paenibacillus motobuensis TaxID=295324 RepID=A0ABN0YLH8_9BACL